MSSLDGFLQMLQQVVEAGGSIDASLADNEIFQSYAAEQAREHENTYWAYAEDDDYWSNLGKKWSGRGLTGAEIQANLFSAQEAQKARDWEERLSNTAHQREVADMQAAGINPALAMANGSNGASTPGSPSPSSVSPGAGGMSFADLISLLKLPAEIKALNATTEKTKVETVGKEIENEWNLTTFIDRANDIHNKAELSVEEVKNAQEYRQEIIANVQLKKEYAKTEEEKQALTRAQAAVEKANEKSILEMLEFNKAYTQAKTETEQAQAIVAMVEAAYKQKLIDSNYIRAQINQMNSQAYAAYKAGKLSEGQLINVNKVGDQLDHSLKIQTGEVFDTNTGSWAANLTGEVANTVIGTFSGFVQMFGQLFNGAGTAALGNLK